MKQLLTLCALLTFFCSCGDKTEAPATDDLAVVTTNFGEIVILLYDDTPKHKQNFIELANNGFFDGTTFHRVINSFMIQGGDPNSKDDIPFNDGQGGPGYTLEAEILPEYIHKKGAVAAARKGDNVNPERRSSGSQFYIVHGKPVTDEELDQLVEMQNKQEKQRLIREYVQRPENKALLQKVQSAMQSGNETEVEALIKEIEPQATATFTPYTYSLEQRTRYKESGGTPFLDRNYTVFGEVIEGLEVVDKIAAQETAAADRPVNDIVMEVSIKTMSRTDIEQTYGVEYP